MGSRQGKGGVAVVKGGRLPRRGAMAVLAGVRVLI